MENVVENDNQILIFDLIIEMVEHIRKGLDLKDFDVSLSETWHEFTISEQSVAYSWVLERMDYLISKVRSHPPRVLHIAERMILSKEAWAWFLKLENLCIVDQSGIEKIIELLMMNYDTDISLKYFKQLVVPMLLESDSSGNIIFPRLKGTESVN